MEVVVRRLPTDSELYHHGIIGQKWGVMHGPPYPLDRKASNGRQLYTTAQIKSMNGPSYDYTRAKVKKNVVRRKKPSESKEGFDIKDLFSSKRKAKTDKLASKKDSSDEADKVIEKKIESKKPVHKMSDRTKKIIKGALIAVAGLTLASVVGAKLYRYNIWKKMNYDTVLNNTKLYRYQNSGEFIRNDGRIAYISSGLLDRIEYAKYEAMQVSVGYRDKGSYFLKAKAKNLKIPSIKKSQSIFSNHLDDAATKSEIKRVFERDLAEYNKKTMTAANKRRIKVYKDALRSINTDSKNTKAIYDAWNTSLTNIDWNNPKEAAMYNKIFDSYRKAGYDAIWDTHDIYISGFRSKNPMIVLNKQKVVNPSVRAMSRAQVKVGNLTGSTVLASRNYRAAIDEIMNDPRSGIRYIKSTPEAVDRYVKTPMTKKIKNKKIRIGRK